MNNKTCSDGATCTLDKRHAGACVDQREVCHCEADYEDYAHHAPSEFVWRQREEREMRKRRDRVELVALWREEVKQRRRENAARYWRY